MGYLIILRGPAGSGKDTIGKRLVEKLGGFNKAYLLDLDIIGSLDLYLIIIATCLKHLHSLQ
jgi:adenylylsulfate kinase-like enzyme